uniref:O-acyltransferase n=1 Tax=Trichobilharzia regenti TaxID=157069 RepID=A0AA85JDM8_TRIRE|nr:unnamed protein product [Trichobilharzia regenti]
MKQNIEDTEDMPSEEMELRQRNDKTNHDKDIKCAFSSSPMVPMMTTSTLSMMKFTPNISEQHTPLQVNTQTSDNDKQKLIHDVVWSDLAEQFRLNLITQLDDHLKVSLSDLVSTAISRENNLQSTQNLNDWMTDKHKNGGHSVNSRSLPTKHYRTRDSVLTTLFQISHIRTVYNIFIAVTIIFSANTVIQDFIDPKVNLYAYNMDILRFAFVLYYFYSILGVLLWITYRPNIGKKVCSLDWIFLICYILYQVAFFTTSFLFTLSSDLPPASTTIVTGEQVRLMMKSHAFVRHAISIIFEEDQNESTSPSPTSSLTKTSTTNNHNNHNSNHSNLSDDIDEFPNFSRYLYFLFAPTLVYRERYPRTRYIRWYFVFSNFLQVIVCFIFSYYIFMRFCFLQFSQLGKLSEFSFKKYILTSTACILPGGLLMLIAFYSFLHSWLNAFAEMLRFGDRLFYKDWWNATTFSVWYRTWNVIVHDWLYTYVYRDIQILLGNRSRTLAATIVFWLSAAVHEYILMVSLRYCLPVLFLFFVVGGYVLFFVQGSGRSWNVAIWISLFTGWGQMICLYSMEWYARKNCPPVLDTWLNFFMPHIIFCPSINGTRYG